MEKQYIKGYVDKSGRVVATNFAEDRDGDRVEVAGLSLKNFLKNPIMLFGHNHSLLPIGKATDLKIEGKNLTFEPVFSTAHELARSVKALWEEGVLKAVSIGFIPHERDGNVFTKAELLEISVVNVPSNPEALAMAKSKGLDTSVLEKEASGNRNLPLASKSQEWNRDQAVKRVKEWADGDFDKYKQAFAWRNEEDSKNFSSYKLPFADVIDGELKAVPRGVTNAQAMLLANQADLDLPEEERRKAHSLLGTYYKEMDRKQPEFRSHTINEVIDLVDKDSLSPEDGYHMVSALHRQVGQSITATQEDVLADALHLAMQQINKISNFSLKKTNDVRRK